MSNAVAQRDPVKELQADLSREAVKGQLAAVLPAHVTPDRFVRIVMTAIAKNPDLAHADRRSFFNSCLEAAADGLMPNGKEAALVLFNTKDGKDDKGKDRWIKKVQYMPMVRGIRKLAFNSGEMKLLDAFAVHANDTFEYSLGFDVDLTHKPPKFGTDRGPIVGVYAVAETKDGVRSLEVMDRNAVEKVRSVSRSKDSGPWVQWWDEMARKTVLRRLAKRLPLSEELERAINRDDALYEVDKRREAGALPSPTTSTAAGQLSAFAAPAMLEHDTDSDADDEQDQPEQTHPLVDTEGEVIFETTSSQAWMAKFEEALKITSDPATLWKVNEVALEWAADMLDGGDETMLRLRQTYLEKPAETVPADDWELELEQLQDGARACKTIPDLNAYKIEVGKRLQALPEAMFERWQSFSKTLAAELKGAK